MICTYVASYDAIMAYRFSENPSTMLITTHLNINAIAMYTLAKMSHTVMSSPFFIGIWILLFLKITYIASYINDQLYSVCLVD